MAGLGSIFVELDLDRKKFTAAEQDVLAKSIGTTVELEKNWRALGTKSSAYYDAMRDRINTSTALIKANKLTTDADIIRAEEAKQAKLAALDEQQYGKQMTLIESLKENWKGLAASVIAVWAAVGKAMEYVDLGAKAQQAEESFRLVAESSKIAADALIANLDRAAAGTVDDSDLMQAAVKGMILGLNDRQLVTIMENARIAARYAGTDVKTAFEDITNAIGTDMPRALKQYGLITREETRQVQAAIAAGAKDISLYDLAMAHAAVNTARFGEAQRNAAESVQIFKRIVNESREAVGNLTISIGQYLLAGAEGINAFATRGVAGLMKLLGQEEAYARLIDASNMMLEKRNALLGIKTEAEQKASETSKKTLADAEAVLKSEQARVKAASERVKMEKESATASDALARIQYESLTAQQKIIDEAQALGNKFLWDQAKEADRISQDALDRQEKILQEAQDLGERFGQEELRNQQELYKAELKAREDLAKEEQRIAEKVAEFERELQEGAWKAVNDAAIAEGQRLKDLEMQFGSVFDAISGAFSTSFDSVIRGTQTVSESFRRMGQSILLSISDLIVKQGLELMKKKLFETLSPLIQSGASALGTYFGGAGAATVPAFAEGGTVPGPIGRPQLAIVHGGEEVIPVGSGTGGGNVFHIDARGAQRGVSAEVMQAIRQGMGQAVKVSLARVSDERRRGGMRGLDR